MTDKVQQEETSDYDAEWGLEDDDSNGQEVATGNDQKTEEGDTVTPDSADDSTEGSTSDNASGDSAESNAEADVWANAPEELRLEYQRSENARLAATNKAKMAQDKLAARGREMKTLRDEKIALEESTRTPTEFETEQETYAKNVSDMIDRKLESRLPQEEQQPEKTAAEIEQEVYETITGAHPDAGEVYNSEGCQAMIAQDPVFKHEGRAYLFSEALNSPDPLLAVAALSHYKSTVSTPTDDSGLSGMLSPSKSSATSLERSTGSLSTAEQYEREWDEDEI